MRMNGDLTMKKLIAIVLGVLVLGSAAFAQNTLNPTLEYWGNKIVSISK